MTGSKLGAVHNAPPSCQASIKRETKRNHAQRCLRHRVDPSSILSTISRMKDDALCEAFLPPPRRWPQRAASAAGLLPNTSTAPPPARRAALAAHAGDDIFTGADLPPEVLSRLTAYYAASLPVALRHPFPAPDDARDVAFDDVLDPAATRDGIDPALRALYDALGPPDAAAAGASVLIAAVPPPSAPSPCPLNVCQALKFDKFCHVFLSQLSQRPARVARAMGAHCRANLRRKYPQQQRHQQGAPSRRQWSVRAVKGRSPFGKRVAYTKRTEILPPCALAQPFI